MSGALRGEVALISGGGSGIGRAVVDAFLTEGASVAVLEHSSEKCEELRALGADIQVIHGDATLATDNRDAVTTAVDAFGSLSVLATFVGVFDHYTPLGAIEEERFDAAFRETYELNVKTAFLAIRASATALANSRGSVVITCSSSSFFPGRGGPLYVSAKHALRGLIVQLAHEMAPEIRVNGVAPGGTIGTDFRGLRALDQLDERLEDRPGRTEDLKKRTPLGLALSPADHAAAYVYFASRAARGVTGEIIRSDGGVSVR